VIHSIRRKYGSKNGNDGIARFTRSTRERPSVKRYDCSPVNKVNKWNEKMNFVVSLVLFPLRY
jgi:hypothetical protein